MKKSSLLIYGLLVAISIVVNAHSALCNSGTKENPLNIDIVATLHNHNFQRDCLVKRALLKIIEDKQFFGQAVQNNQIPQDLLERAMQLWFFRNYYLLAQALGYTKQWRFRLPQGTQKIVSHDGGTTYQLPHGIVIRRALIEHHPRVLVRSRVLGHGVDRHTEPAYYTEASYVTKTTIAGNDNTVIYSRCDASYNQQIFKCFEDGTICIDGTYYRPEIEKALRNVRSSDELAQLILNPGYITSLQRGCAIM